MTRRILAVVGSALCLAILATAATAAGPVVELIPPDALGFVTVQNLGQADGKLEALGRKMQVPIPSLLDKVKKEGGIAAGLDEKGDAALIAMPAKNADGPPIVVLVVPVSDYAAFIGQFEPGKAKGGITEVTALDASFLAANKGDYALLAEPKHRKALKAVLTNKEGPADEVKALGDWLAENDASLVVTRPGVKLISEKIQEAMRDMQTIFDGLDSRHMEVPPNVEMVGAMFTMYEQFFAAMGEEVATLSVGAQLPDDGAIIGLTRVQAVEGGELARATRNLKNPIDNMLAGVPAGPYVVAGGMAIPEGIVDTMSELTVAIFRAAPAIYGVPEDKIDDMAELNAASMKGFRGMSMAMGVGEPGSPIYGNLTGAMFVDDAEKYLDTYLNTIEEMKKLIGEKKNTVFSGMKVTEVKIAGRKALRLSMDLTAMLPGMIEVPEMARMFEVMYGPGGKMTFLMAVAGEKIVAFGSTEELLKSAIEGADEGGLAADTELKKTAARLLPGAQAVGYWSVPGTVALMNRAIPALAPPGTPQIKFPPFPDTPPIGYAAKAADGVIDMQMVVPPEVLQSVMGYFIQVQMMQMQQQQLENPPADEI